MIGLSALAHKLAAELKGKSQDSIPVSALYVKNAIVLQIESLQNVSRSGEKGGPSATQMVESRILYVRK